MLQSYTSAKIYHIRPKAGGLRPKAESCETPPEAALGDNAAAGGGEGRSDIRSGRRPDIEAKGRKSPHAAGGGVERQRRRRRRGGAVQYQVRPKAGVLRPKAESRPTPPEAVWKDNAAAGGGEGRSNIQRSDFFTLRITQAGLLV